MVITIDGPAGVGKSTAAKTLARRLGLMYLDTGATYRTLAYAARRRQLHPVADADRIAELARQLPIELRVRDDGSLQVRLSGEDISAAIRTEEVTEAAALVSQHPPVRRALVKRQRELADRHGVVVEGRDTGSVVFPKASHKFFLDADPEVRAHRRQRELARLYGARSPIAQIREQLHFRDGLDRTRRVGPLVKPRGAIAINTTHRTINQVVQMMLRHIRRNRPER
ncbi:MAG: (d)CMP kinase [Candidatus Omnitrophica bacterium]|nr:(d)CMP kinase [Candidatus Omnitrophota bacterium]